MGKEVHKKEVVVANEESPQFGEVIEEAQWVSKKGTGGGLKLPQQIKELLNGLSAGQIYRIKEKDLVKHIQSKSKEGRIYPGHLKKMLKREIGEGKEFKIKQSENVIGIQLVK